MTRSQGGEFKCGAVLVKETPGFARFFCHMRRWPRPRKQTLKRNGLARCLNLELARIATVMNNYGCLQTMVYGIW